jgi:hypothetical protein
LIDCFDHSTRGEISLAPFPNNQSPSENIPVGTFDWKYASSAISSSADKNCSPISPRSSKSRFAQAFAERCELA